MTFKERIQKSKSIKGLFLLIVFLIVGYQVYTVVVFYTREESWDIHGDYLEAAILEAFPEVSEVRRERAHVWPEEGIRTFRLIVTLSPDVVTFENFGSIVLRIDNKVDEVASRRQMEEYLEFIRVNLNRDDYRIHWRSGNSHFSLWPWRLSDLYEEGNSGDLIVYDGREESKIIVGGRLSVDKAYGGMAIEEIQPALDGIYKFPEQSKYISERLYNHLLVEGIDIWPIWTSGGRLFPSPRYSRGEFNIWEVDKIQISIFINRELVPKNEFEEYVRSVTPYIYSLFEEMELIPFQLSISRIGMGEEEFRIDWFPLSDGDYGELSMWFGVSNMVWYEKIPINQLQNTIELYVEEN